MKRPSRTVRRESVLKTPGRGGRPLVLFVPPTADVLIVREKGRRIAYAVDVLSVFHLGARRAAAASLAQRRGRKRR